MQAGARMDDLGSAYLDGALCVLNEDGTTSFSGMAASDTIGAAELVYFAFDLLFVDGASIGRSSSARCASRRYSPAPLGAIRSAPIKLI
jgi:hypothetical protein